MTYRGVVPVVAWGGTFVAMGVMASAQLFALRNIDLIGKLVFSAVLACAVLGIIQMSYRRARGDRNFGVGEEIKRWRAWALFLGSAIWLAVSFVIVWTNS